MKNNFEKQINTVAKDVKLSKSEKAQMLSELKSHMEFSPRGTRQPVPSPWLFSVRGLATALVLVLVLTTGGTALAAEGALPGDVLYSVKTNVNERAVRALLFTKKRKDEWDIRLADRRLEEFQTLTERGELDARRKKEIERRISDHTTRLQNILEHTNENSPRAREIERRLDMLEEIKVGKIEEIIQQRVDTRVQETRGTNEVHLEENRPVEPIERTQDTRGNDRPSGQPAQETIRPEVEREDDSREVDRVDQRPRDTR